jgi:hypothetical protein
VNTTDILDAIDLAVGDATVSGDAMRCTGSAQDKEPEMWAWIGSAYSDVPGIANMDAYAVGLSSVSMRVRFDNGRYASVAPNGSVLNSGRYELALVEHDGTVAYDDGFNDAVCGLDDAEVIETLRAIAALPALIGA